jgi:DNA polymerase I
VTLALLDGDIIAYRAACGMEKVHDWGDTGGKVSEVDTHKAAEEAVKLAEQWADAVDAKEVIVGFTSSDKFRTRILSSYKANRPGQKPAAHAAAVQAVKDRFPHHLIRGLEADDILGILMTTPKYADKAVMVSIDKDFRTIPGRLFNPMRVQDGIVTITPDQADFWWMYQTLIGDSADNYKGCPGIGPKKAHAILGALYRPVDELWPRVVAAFKEKKLTEDDALVQARVARILRREDYDKKTKEIILWHPTTPMRIPVEQPASSA